MTNLPSLITIFLVLSPFPFLFTFILGKRCNYCQEGQGYKNTLNKSQFRDLNNMLRRCSHEFET